MSTLKNFLEHKAYLMRVNSLLMTTEAGSGYLTSALSAADIVACLFFHTMRYDPKNPKNPDNDRFILSKEHAAPIVYAAWKEAGVLTQEQLMTYRQFDSILGGDHTLRFDRTEVATGSLGTGLSIGAGMAMSAKMDHRDFYTYVMVGDSEVTEGAIWEAAEVAPYYKLNNLVAILDGNRLGKSTATMHQHNLHRYEQEFQAFGWHTIMIDGHDMQQVMAALDKARQQQEAPTIIIAKTFKGYGVEQVEDKEGCHGKVFTKKELETILPSMEKRFATAAHFDVSTFVWAPTMPRPCANKTPQKLEEKIELAVPHYTMGQEVAPCQAYGEALRAAGVACASVVALDAEVKNSTRTEIFEEKFPERFIQCFVAEQNMVNMAVGLDCRGKIPFVTTFAAFFARAYDQVRMAAVGRAKLRLCGSFPGISMHGGSAHQMGLEDIGMMRAIPDCVVLYPSDAVSTHKLVQEMANYHKGISYIRTTALTMPVIYDLNEQFPIGGCKVVHQSQQDKVCIIGAGVTLHQACKAYSQLQECGIAVTVIDLYCVQPLDAVTIIKAANAAGDKVITVEDHYLQGGLGQAVVYALRNTAIMVECLAVTQLPPSGGTPEHLMAWAGIDAAAIVKKVKELI